MKLQPLNDRVLVKRLETEEKTAGGLYIPDTAKEKPMEGTVIAVPRDQEGVIVHFDNILTPRTLGANAKLEYL